MSKKPWERELPRPPSKGQVVRSIVLDHIRWHEMRPVPLIHRFVVEDYGEITCRSVYRHIKALVEEGVVRRTQDDSEDTFGYVRATKPRWNRTEQVYA